MCTRGHNLSLRNLVNDQAAPEGMNIYMDEENGKQKRLKNRRGNAKEGDDIRQQLR